MDVEVVIQLKVLYWCLSGRTEENR